MALGARPVDVLRLVLRQIALLVAVGTLVGIAAALALTRFAGSLLFEVAPRDPGTFVIAIVALIVAGLTAALVPARRALRVDPITVLRVE
jgi:ABC-type antimicrobial peptide transport system permease subunit